MHKPWQGPVPTVEEAAAYLEADAAYLTGERPTTTAPEIRPLATWAGSTGIVTVTQWSVDVALITYGRWSSYRAREVSTAITLFQVTQGGLATDGWATFDIYKVDRFLDESQARQVADLLLAGPPQLLGSGEI